MNKHRIIFKLVETEKSDRAKENNIYTFWVDRKANKNQISEAMTELFGVKPKKIRTMIMPGKPKRLWRQNRYVYTQAKKKALIELADQEEIDLTKIR